MSGIGLLLQIPQWRDRFTQLACGDHPKVKGFASRASSPTWVTDPGLQSAFWLLRKGESNQFAVFDDQGEKVWPPKGTDLMIPVVRSIAHYDGGPEGSETWWDFGEIVRYLSPWTHPNPPLQHRLYLSPGQYEHYRTGSAESLHTLMYEGYSTTFPAVAS